MAASLTPYARAGFTKLSEARDKVAHMSEVLGVSHNMLLESLGASADPDRAVEWLERLSLCSDEHLEALRLVINDPISAQRLGKILGGSRGLAEFLERHHHAISQCAKMPHLPVDQVEIERDIRKVVDISSPVARDSLRVAYRTVLLDIALWDFNQEDPAQGIPQVTQALSHLAGAVLNVALDIAYLECEEYFSAREIALVDFSIIAMGKCGALELNYLSDVDVIYVAETRDEDALESDKAMTIATRVAQHTAKAVMEPSVEPGLWEVDTNLRPEGKDGVLVRTLESHVSYYERWAKDWEFQALLKARPIAGSLELGSRYMEAVHNKVWSSANRTDFVEQVQHMRERVTDHIPDEELDFQIKLGPGGLRDVEFTVQLLQLVHGLSDESVRTQNTLESLERLSEAGYVGREDAHAFAAGYRMLRLLEHRLQLRNLTRTHLMPQSEEEQRVLARSTGLFTTADGVINDWQKTKLHVRELHEKLFYRPLLAAVAQLPEETHKLSSEQAQARLAAIGFHNPQGALNHIAALTSGVSRRAAIQRALLPVMLQWLSEGANPDHGLLTFRILSEKLGESHWFLKMLRDSAGAAQRLMTVLGGSKYVADLMELIPESAAWFDDEADMQPIPYATLMSEMQAIVSRHEQDTQSAKKALRALRRREILRLAIGYILNVLPIESIGEGLSDVTMVVLSGYLELALKESQHNPEFAVIALGRFGGRELGFDSDADVIYVYRDSDVCQGAEALERAERITIRIAELSEDPRLPFEIDTELRPEGKKGPVVRSLESYQSYYERWSSLWESQALLRAREVAGTSTLLSDLMNVVDLVRYPASISEEDIREIRRIKARVEAERLPQGADPLRHVKLGRGSLSDVEWTAQLLQLMHAHSNLDLRTTSTVKTLLASQDAKLLTQEDAQKLIEAWTYASRVRSAITIWSDRSSDVLPNDVHDLEGIARLMGYPPGSASTLEEEYLSITRKARHVVERVFYDF